MLIKAGTVLVLGHGASSDYSFDGPFRVLKDFDQAEVSEVFREAWRTQPMDDGYGRIVQPRKRDEWEKPDVSQFIAWLAARRYIEDIETHRWYIGSFSFDPLIQDDPAPGGTEQ